jgi:[acyl-carrier-protein] S-malonyltransferase
MAAIIGLEDAAVESICNASSVGTFEVVPANYNSEGQIVVSGDQQAVERTVELALEAGALKAVVLPVSGAFHSPLMEEAQAGLARALESVSISRPAFPVFSNVTARPMTDPEEIRQRLIEQLTSPVRWTQILRAMQTEGVSAFVEVGTGRVLSGLVRRTLGRDISVSQAGVVKDFDALIETTQTSDS